MTDAQHAPTPAERLAPYESFLGGARNAILCIAREPEAPTGALPPPHATPVWFDYRDGRFRLSITRTRVKYRLLARQGQVTLVVDESPGFRTVIVEGPTRVTDEAAELVALRRALWRKYRGGDADGVSDDQLLAGLRAEERVVVLLEPERVLCWDGSA